MSEIATSNRFCAHYGDQLTIDFQINGIKNKQYLTSGGNIEGTDIHHD